MKAWSEIPSDVRAAVDEQVLRDNAFGATTTLWRLDLSLLNVQRLVAERFTALAEPSWTTRPARSG